MKVTSMKMSELSFAHPNYTLNILLALVLSLCQKHTSSQYEILSHCYLSCVCDFQKWSYSISFAFISHYLCMYNKFIFEYFAFTLIINLIKIVFDLGFFFQPCLCYGPNK